MRGRAPVPAAVIGCLLLGLGSAVPAQAQSTAPAVNNGALDALKPPTPAPRPRPAHRAPPSRTPAPAPKTAERLAPGPIPVPPKPPTLPVAPPEIAAIPPAVAVPVQRPPEPPPIPVAADAPGDVAPLQGGVRATFGPNRSELNEATETAIRGFARPLRDTQQAVQVAAYAAGTPEDPSTPRRLSLARALAARAVLINEGIASTRIYVRALGAAAGDGPADRVDLSTNAPGTAAPVAAPPSPATAPPAATP